MDEPRSTDVTRELSFGRESADGGTERKTIRPATETDLGGLHSLGRAFGEFPDLVLYEAFLHCPRFFERVVAYRIVRDDETRLVEARIRRALVFIEFFEGAEPAGPKG